MNSDIPEFDITEMDKQTILGHAIQLTIHHKEYSAEQAVMIAAHTASLTCTNDLKREAFAKAIYQKAREAKRETDAAITKRLEEKKQKEQDEKDKANERIRQASVRPQS